jgi:cysteine desulfurase
VKVDELKNAIRPTTALVAVMMANNEIGTIQPIKEIAEICRENNVLLFADGAQAVGKIPVNVAELGADFVSIAAHKFYGPKGIGALYCRNGVFPTPVIYGAGQESGIRSGTENVPGIAGLGVAAKLAYQEFCDGHEEQVRNLRDSLEEQLRQGIPDLVVNGSSNNAERLPNTLSVSFPGVRSYQLVDALRTRVCFSTGAACATRNSKSATLSAMGVPDDVALGTIRLSIGRYTTQSEIDKSAAIIIETVHNIRINGDSQ